MSSLKSVLPPSNDHHNPTLLIPSSQPIPLLSTPTARAYSYASTAGILFYYYLRSTALVTDPLTTLIQDLLPLVLFQALFSAVCLPIAGSWNSGTGDTGRSGKLHENSAAAAKKSTGTSGTGSMRRRPGAPGTTPKGLSAGRLSSDHIASGSWQSKIMPTTLSLLLTLAVPPVPLALLAFVLGAPLYPTSLIPHTFALALHVSVLAVLPIFYTHGVSSIAWRDVAAAWLPFDEAGVWGGTVGTFVGGWIGAIPIALDWDREWQKWPCTVLWGAALGWATGRMLTMGLRFGIGSRINFSISSTEPAQDNTSIQVVAENNKQK